MIRKIVDRVSLPLTCAAFLFLIYFLVLWIRGALTGYWEAQ